MTEPTPKKLVTPIDRELLTGLTAGDRVLISGDMLVFRDQVHRELCSLLERGEALPVDLRDAVVYYCGPTPGREGRPVGSAGPTTSARMDQYTPALLEAGLAVTIGKGDRSDAVVEAFARYGAVYLAATGGVGALLGLTVLSARVVAYPEFGPEALRVFRVRDFPAVVGIDSHGGSAFAVPEADTGHCR
jgi:fumarate hydratase subunit beta